MFAFAIYDSLEQKVFLARDRYGIKPLYYTIKNSTLIFGSEIKAIKEHPLYQVNIDKEALVEYMTFQNFFSSDTLYKNVKIFPNSSSFFL